MKCATKQRVRTFIIYLHVWYILSHHLDQDWLADGLSASCEGVLIVSALIYTAENVS